ncbi:MAG: DUF362 domain-containing protein [Bacteroidetes bacterium]|nr:DUF362 domain-containing protein [Bacteroidota bacterium]
MGLNLSRRDFFKLTTITSIGLTVSSFFGIKTKAQDKPLEEIKTNIADALKHPRNANSMPGKFPGKVAQVNHENSIKDNVINADAAYEMLAKGMLSLTGAATLPEAWKQFVNENDRIGLKVNPVAGPTLSTSVELTQAIVKQLEESGIRTKNILIWDRREPELHDAGFTDDKFPGIKIIGTERQENDSWYDENGKLYGERMIDKEWYYWANCEMEYDAETMPYMINQGEYSYFSKIATQMVDKIINVPILKNAGASITLCLKNLAYGVTSNTARLHKPLWSETCAEVCAFPPIRDKVVLNIVDGIKGCFNGGPGADPQFITDYKTLLVGTDPVAVDRIGYDIILQKRIKEKLQKVESERGMKFLGLASDLELGVSDINKIKLEKIEMA